MYVEEDTYTLVVILILR